MCIRWRFKRYSRIPRSYRRSHCRPRPATESRPSRYESWISECDFAANFVSWKIPCANGLAQLFKCEHVMGERLAIRKLVSAIGAFCIQEIEQAGRAAAVGLFADGARLLGLINVAAAIER